MPSSSEMTLANYEMFALCIPEGRCLVFVVTMRDTNIQLHGRRWKIDYLIYEIKWLGRVITLLFLIKEDTQKRQDKTNKALSVYHWTSGYKRGKQWKPTPIHYNRKNRKIVIEFCFLEKDEGWLPSRSLYTLLIARVSWLPPPGAGVDWILALRKVGQLKNVLFLFSSVNCSQGDSKSTALGCVAVMGKSATNLVGYEGIFFHCPLL